MSSNAELAAVLRRIAELVNRDDADMGWSVYEIDRLRSEVRTFLERTESGLVLGEAEREHLRLLFAATGPLQEMSMASGWASEYLALAARFDDAVLADHNGLSDSVRPVARGIRFVRSVRSLCENFLYRFKAAPRGRSRRRLGGQAVAPAAAPAPAGQTTPVGWREETREGAAYTRRRSRGRGDLTRGPLAAAPIGLPGAS